MMCKAGKAPLKKFFQAEKSTKINYFPFQLFLLTSKETNHPKTMDDTLSIKAQHQGRCELSLLRNNFQLRKK